MTLKYVDSVPKRTKKNTQNRRRKYNEVTRLIEDFVNDSRNVARIELDHYEYYKSTKSFATTIRRAVRDLGCPVRVCKVGDEIYLAKK